MSEPVGGYSENDTFCDEAKPFFNDNNDISQMNDAMGEETMDNDSEPSFTGGNDHADSSECILSLRMFRSCIKFNYSNND